MSERIPEYGATEGPAPAAGVLVSDRDALDDACSKAFDMVVEEAENVRQHVCLHPFHLDVGAEFLESMRHFAFAVDTYTNASAAAEAVAPMDHVAPVFAITHEAAWRAGFSAGAVAQRDWMVAYARSRGWVSTATAIELTKAVDPPAIVEEATAIVEEATDVRA